MGKSLENNSMPIIGEWKLISFETHTGSGDVSYPFGEDPQGCIIYAESGRFSVQLMRTNRPHFASGDQLKGTVGEIEANYQGCIAYYGSYTIDRDGGFLVHHVEGSLFPNWEGQDLKRYFELSGNRLKLTTPPTLWGGGGEIVGMLEWERIG
ncbi:MAG TPA: lipocalin-like domain-containing protein [Anaerolineaceae bacterium]|nr:lipocalin-like domain-containing protein [Anaerolineaceae bacterium]